MLSDRVAERVIAARKQQGLTRAELAERCRGLGLTGLTTASLGNLETGRPGPGGSRRREVSVDEWITLAAALALPPLDLLLPVGTQVSVDLLSVTPGLGVSVDRAVEWLAQGWAPPGFPEIDSAARRPLIRVARQASLIASIRGVDTDLAAPDWQDGYLAELRTMRANLWEDLLKHRLAMERDGLTPPALPEDLAEQEAADRARLEATPPRGVSAREATADA